MTTLPATQPRRRKRPPATMTSEAYRALEPEAAFQSWVVDTARLRHWLVAHVTDSRRQDATGLPDLVMARGGVVLLVELKSETGRTTPRQDAWLRASGGCLWRPSMRAEISAVLA